MSGRTGDRRGKKAGRPAPKRPAKVASGTAPGPKKGAAKLPPGAAPAKSAPRTKSPAPRRSAALSSAWAEAIFEGSRDAIFVSDTKSRFVAVNEAACGLTGYGRDELLRMKIPDLHEEMDLHAFRTYHDRILGGEEILSRAAVRRKDGSKVETEFSSRAATIAGKRFMHTVARDITQRLEAETALRESEERYRLLFGQSILCIFQSTPDGKVIAVNEAFASMFGFDSPAELMASVLDVATDNYADPAQRIALVGKVLGADGAVRVENLYRRKDGTMFPGILHAWRVGDPSRGGVRIEGFIEDIGDRKRAEERVRAAEEHSRYALDTVPDPVFVKDEQHRWRILNDACCRFMGYPREELIGKSDFDFFPREEAEVFWAKDDEVFASGRENVNEERFTSADGTQHTISTKKAVYTDSQTGRPILVGVIREITEEKRLAEELRHHREHLEELVLERTQELAAINERLVREMEDRGRAELLRAAIYEISEATQQAGSLDELYAAVHAVVGRFMNTSSFFIALFEQEQNLITFPYYVSSVIKPPAPFPPGRGLTSHVLRTGKPLLGTPEVLEEFRRRGDIRTIGKAAVSWLGVPLTIGDRVIGVLAVQTFSEDVRYGERDLEALTFVSRQVAVAIERKRAAQALRESEEKFRTTVEEFSEGLLLADEDGKVAVWNAAVERLFGIRREEALGRPLWDVVWHGYLPDRETPASYERVRDSVQRILRDKALPNIPSEAAVRAPDGSVRTVQQTAFLIETERGARLGAVFSDITERKKADEALRASEERLSLALESTGLGMWDWRLDTGKLTLNEQWAAMLGYTLQELEDEKDPWQTRVHPDDLAPTIDALERHFRDETPVYGSEHRLRTKSGGWIWVSDRGRVVERAADGTSLRITGTQRDITERKRAENALLASEERYRLVFQRAPVGVVHYDVSLRITDCNDRFVSFLESSPERLIGLDMNTLDDKRLLPAISAAVRGEFGEYIGPYQATTSSASRVGSLRTAPLRSQDGTIIGGVAIVEDMTDHLRLEEQLRHSQKMEAVGHLAGGVAHDFNNLMQAMLSQTHFLRAAGGDPAKVTALAQELEEQVGRGAALTRQLLLFSRRETTRPERLDLNDVVRDAARMLRRLVRENIALSIQLTGEPLTVEADRGQLQQVLMNLAVNASDAMPGGGTLTIRSASVDPDWVSLRVEDTGHGIPDEIRDRIFEPFFTTKSAGRGTGLGLSVVHGIVSSHGGRVEVESAVREGSAFVIVLPRAAAGTPDQAGETAPVAAEPALGRGERVLVVEDEDGARVGLRDIFASLGYEVTAVASGEEALALPDEPPFDLLLTDLMLPGIGGPEVATTLQRRRPELKVILMSGYAQGDAVRLGVASGRVRFLQKPFDMATLAREVRAALDEDRAPDGA